MGSWFDAPKLRRINIHSTNPIHSTLFTHAPPTPCPSANCRVDLIDAPKRRRINIDPARLAELRDREARRAGEEAPRGPFDSGRGVRIQVRVCF